ncbi:hypothetical protein BDB00DRAFT_868072 [Zychaea mexicana]|uniref:uncharacterized protein n=1 Tax=Zychaea mexicana TaxID=64656 RepID=UPI0022FEEDAE|nr:uncharacterized protein BDB00DRAFT_868072 [Zychaea mexicana]KAI9497940.1 hypothetical protein BDB00DRAFT_868072 [Zychaea mexicana]
MNRFSVTARRAYSLGGRQGMGVNKPSMNNFPVGNQTQGANEQWTNEMMTSAPKWNEKLATESEANVKADQEPVNNVQDLKSRTEHWFREHEHDKSFEMDVE